MKSTVATLSLLLIFLLVTITGLQIVDLASANFVPAADVSITSPTNKTYTSNLLLLNCTVYFTLTENKLIVYSLDEGANVTIFSKQSSQFYETVCEQEILPKLSDGPHHLEVYAVYAEGEGAQGFAQVYFNIDTIPPTVSNLSVQNKTYYSIDVPLNFNLNETTSQISYNLDKNTKVAIDGNTTLTGLAEGSHSLAVYFNDTFGNMGQSETIYFTIARESNRQTESLPVLAAVVSVAAVAIVSAGLLVYLKKHKERKQT